MTFEMTGRLDTCVLLSYAIDPERAAALVPPPLEFITSHASAFLNIVVCHVDRMRPRFAPQALGVSCWHVAYRLHVRTRPAEGQWLEGLYFLRTDVDRPVVGMLGNQVTDLAVSSRSDLRFRQRRGVECGRE